MQGAGTASLVVEENLGTLVIKVHILGAKFSVESLKDTNIWWVWAPLLVVVYRTKSGRPWTIQRTLDGDNRSHIYMVRVEVMQWTGTWKIAVFTLGLPIDAN